MRIEVEAKLILTVPEPKQGESAGDIILAIEQGINKHVAFMFMTKTNTKVGLRIHISGKEPKVTK